MAKRSEDLGFGGIVKKVSEKTRRVGKVEEPPKVLPYHLVSI